MAPAPRTRTGPVDVSRIHRIGLRRGTLTTPADRLPPGRNRTGLDAGPAVDDRTAPAASVVSVSNPQRWRPMLHVVGGAIVNSPTVAPSMRVDGTAALDWVCKVVDTADPRNRATGFVVGADLIMTNRHVWSVIQDDLDRIELWFGHARGDGPPHVARVTGAVFTGPAGGGPEGGPLDVAVLRVTGIPAATGAAVFADGPGARAGDTVVTVGYPDRPKSSAGHASASAPARALGDPALIGRKRVSPGMVLALRDQALLHDCSTTNGSSGSPLLDATTDQVVGIHTGAMRIAGRAVNVAVPAADVLRATDAAELALQRAG